MIFRKNKPALTGTPHSRKLPWRTIIAVIFGLAVTACSWWYLQQYIATHQKLEQITVLSRDMPAYTVITPADIGTRTIIAGAREPNAIINAQELIGKMAATKLYKGEQVRRERLIITDEDKNRQIVTVSIDPVRWNAVVPGDLVDVYWVPNENIPGAILALNARVVEIRDGEGTPVSSAPPSGMAAAVQQGTQTNKVPAMVTLSVKPEEVPQMVRGAAAGSKGVVLVKKLRPTSGTVPSVATEPVQEQPTGNIPGKQVQKPPQ